jgi:hypothetical protein
MTCNPSTRSRLGSPSPAGSRPSGQVAGRRSVARWLSAGSTLLVMDNFEHLVPATAMIQEWLEAGPDVSVLATSRRSLGLKAEPLLVGSASRSVPSGAVKQLGEEKEPSGCSENCRHQGGTEEAAATEEPECPSVQRSHIVHGDHGIAPRGPDRLRQDGHSRPNAERRNSRHRRRTSPALLSWRSIQGVRDEPTR